MFVNGVNVEKRVNLAAKTKTYRVYIQVGRGQEVHLLRRKFKAHMPARIYGLGVLARVKKLEASHEAAV